MPANSRNNLLTKTPPSLVERADLTLKHSIASIPASSRDFLYLFESSPCARQACLNIAAYLTNLIPFDALPQSRTMKIVSTIDPEQSLLTHMLNDGIQSWKKSSTYHDFLAGLFNQIHRISPWQAYARKSVSSTHWDFCLGPLQAWMDLNTQTPYLARRQTIVSPTLSNEAIRHLIAFRVLPAATLESSDSIAFLS